MGEAAWPAWLDTGRGRLGEAAGTRAWNPSGPRPEGSHALSGSIRQDELLTQLHIASFL